jgi:SAM-dependent methyltransferase
MRRRYRYRASDFDLRAHRGELVLDLEDLDLPDVCLDIVLSSHVLEHVPDTDAALAELHRVLRPGGRLLLQVPLLQARTTRPPAAETHSDDTLVAWRFGHDLADRLGAHGFSVAVCVTEDLHRRVRTGDVAYAHRAPEFDIEGVVGAAPADQVVTVASNELARLLGIEPSYMFVVWDCEKPHRLSPVRRPDAWPAVRPRRGVHGKQGGTAR